MRHERRRLSPLQTSALQDHRIPVYHLFRAGVVERFGACCDDMQGLIRMVAGDGECDAGSVEWSPTATSRITRAAQCVVFSTVVAEARMVRDVMDLDVYGRERAALPGAGPRGTRGGG